MYIRRTETKVVDNRWGENGTGTSPKGYAPKRLNRQNGARSGFARNNRHQNYVTNWGPQRPWGKQKTSKLC